MCVCVQDAEAYNQRNINEEGGGGYLAYVWDCAYWGTQVKLAQFTGSSTYSAEVPSHLMHTFPQGPYASAHTCPCRLLSQPTYLALSMQCHTGPQTLTQALSGSFGL